MWWYFWSSGGTGTVGPLPPITNAQRQPFRGRAFGGNAFVGLAFIPGENLPPAIPLVWAVPVTCLTWCNPVTTLTWCNPAKK